MAKAIRLKVLYEGKVFDLETHANEYRNLMSLIYDRIYIDCFGECKGIGRCGTCHVHIIEGRRELLQPHGNEITTLNKMPDIAINSRLACNIPIDETLQGVQIEIVNEDNPGLY